MDLLLKEDKKYVLNGKECYFKADIESSMFFTNPKAVFNFTDGTQITCVYALLEGKYTWTGGDSIQNGNLSYLGSAWIIRDYKNI